MGAIAGGAIGATAGGSGGTISSGESQRGTCRHVPLAQSHVHMQDAFAVVAPSASNSAAINSLSVIGTPRCV